MRIKQQIKAFTVLELMLSMALSAVLVAFAFMGFNQLQKLFHDYNQQSAFIAEIMQLNAAFTHLSDKAELIEKQDDKTLLFKSDSSQAQLIIQENSLLLKFSNHTDTFHLKPEKTELKTLNLSSEKSSNIVTQFDTDVFFRKQKFHVSFRKEYDAESILKTSLELMPPDEFHWSIKISKQAW